MSSDLSAIANLAKSFVLGCFSASSYESLVSVVSSFRVSLLECGEKKVSFIDSKAPIGVQLEQARLVARSVLDPRFGEVWNSPEKRIGYNPGSARYYGQAQKMRNNLKARVIMGWREAKESLNLAKDLRYIASEDPEKSLEYIEEAKKAVSAALVARDTAKKARNLLKKASDLELAILYEKAGEEEKFEKLVGGTLGSFGTWGITQPQT